MNEDETAGSFLRALAHWFPKPGEWKIKSLLKDEHYKVPTGEVHEVYVSSVAGETLMLQGPAEPRAMNDNVGDWAILIGGHWVPNFKTDNGVMTVSQWTQTGSVFDATAYDVGVILGSVDTKGWILTTGIDLFLLGGGNGDWYVLYRRRYDLERHNP